MKFQVIISRIDRITVDVNAANEAEAVKKVESNPYPDTLDFDNCAKTEVTYEAIKV